MSILTKDEIIEEINRGNITITPLEPNNVGPGSIDLTLGDKFRVFKKTKKVYDLDETLDYKTITDLVTSPSIVVKPQETVLGITRERVKLSSNLCGWLEGRSRFARVGLMVHISASFMQPGIDNHQVLEISNMGHVPLRLHVGTKICQFVFQKAEGNARYQGRFENQIEP